MSAEPVNSEMGTELMTGVKQLSIERRADMLYALYRVDVTCAGLADWECA